MFTAYNGHPLWPVESEQWEIEHVHHVNMQKLSITTTPLNKLGYASVAIGENLAVKD